MLLKRMMHCTVLVVYMPVGLTYSCFAGEPVAYAALLSLEANQVGKPDRPMPIILMTTGSLPDSEEGHNGSATVVDPEHKLSYRSKLASLAQPLTTGLRNKNAITSLAVDRVCARVHTFCVFNAI